MWLASGNKTINDVSIQLTCQIEQITGGADTGILLIVVFPI